MRCALFMPLVVLLATFSLARSVMAGPALVPPLPPAAGTIAPAATPDAATALPPDAAMALPPEPAATLRGPGLDHHYRLVEEFTADTLAAGEVKLGTDLDFGLTDRLMIGTDLVASVIGAPTVQAKMRVWQSGKNKVALGLRAAYLSKSTLLWGSINQHFDQLDARVLRPSISWTNTISPRLKLHVFWAKGFGRINAHLSEKGRRKLWETKHPGDDYDQRDPVTEAPNPDAHSPTSANQEKAASRQSSLTQESLQVQSITGLAQDRFQMTGEFTRAGGNKILVTTRIEQTEIERLRSSAFRLTIAHQWIWPSFTMRLGLGPQYAAVTGHDLDDEKIDDSGWLIVPDLAFYWRF